MKGSVIWEIIRFNSLRIEREQTDGVIPKIRQRCLIVIVLPIQNRKRPSSTVGGNNLGLPLFLLSINCNVLGTGYITLTSRTNTSLVTPVNEKNDCGSALSYACCQGDDSGNKMAARWSLDLSANIRLVRKRGPPCRNGFLRPT